MEPITLLAATEFWSTAGGAVALGGTVAGVAGYLAVLKERTRGVPKLQRHVSDEMRGLRDDFKRVGDDLGDKIDAVRETVARHGEKIARLDERTRSNGKAPKHPG